MKEAQIAVNVRVPLGEDDLRQANDPTFIRECMEYMRGQAQELAESVGGRVVTDRMPSFVQPQIASHATFGGNWFLWASRWWVEIPDHVNVDPVA